MRHFFLGLCLLLPLFTFAQRDIEYQEYSYSEFFQMIEDEQDTVFRLSDAHIKFDPKTDSLFKWNFGNTGSDGTSKLVVNKKLELNNVQFFAGYGNADGSNLDNSAFGGWINIEFKKDVILKNTSTINIFNCKFEGAFSFDYEQGIIETEMFFETVGIFIFNSNFNIFSMSKNGSSSNNFQINPVIRNNSFKSESKGSRAFYLLFINYFNSVFENNKIETKGSVSIYHKDSDMGIDFLNNEIISDDISIGFSRLDGKIDWKSNDFSSPFKLSIDELDKQSEFDWKSLKGKVISRSGYDDFNQKVGYSQFSAWEKDTTIKSPLAVYMDSVRYYDADVFANEIALKGTFYEHYKSKYQTATANEVYLELKDFETERLRIIYEQERTFDTFFKWKINQFLKLFAAYGTEPAKAITMSVYVIIIFAVIYLFFPNYWDSHGKKRLKHRFGFFYKYMSLNAGIQDVYLEENKTEIQDNEAFKTLLIEHKEQAPKMFFNLAMPLYRWSVASTVAHAWLIKRFDFLKGTWQDTDPKGRGFKSVLIGTIFITTLLYDIFIKMLNALMLSINTFTTLGFGEIPIKGLPRYLAIIQGFIGWFMLTIFSVSLISQVLN